MVKVRLYKLPDSKQSLDRLYDAYIGKGWNYSTENKEAKAMERVRVSVPSKPSWASKEWTLKSIEGFQSQQLVIGSDTAVDLLHTADFLNIIYNRLADYTYEGRMPGESAHPTMRNQLELRFGK